MCACWCTVLLTVADYFYVESVFTDCSDISFVASKLD